MKFDVVVFKATRNPSVAFSGSSVKEVTESKLMETWMSTLKGMNLTGAALLVMTADSSRRLIETGKLVKEEILFQYGSY